MKNKTTKTIACLLAGLTLSACGTLAVKDPANSQEDDNSQQTSTRQGTTSKPDVTARILSGNNYVAGDGNGTYSYSCEGRNCNSGISSSIRIRPVQDTSGVATYSGAVSARTFVRTDTRYRLGFGTTSTHIYDNHSGNVNIRVDFSSKTIGASTTISGSTFSLNGRFNPNGSVSGTASIGQSSGRLIGLIGQTRLIGTFKGYDRNFSGGFNTYRQ